MNDPIRLLDAQDEALAYERELLDAARNLGPPPGAREQIWAAMGPHLGPGGGGGGGDGGSSGHAATQGATNVGASGASSSGASISGVVGGFKGIILGIAGVSATAGVIAAVMAISAPVTPPSSAPLPRVETTIAPTPNKTTVEHTDEQSPIKEVIAAPSAVIAPDALPRQTITPSASIPKSAHVAPPASEETDEEETDSDDTPSEKPAAEAVAPDKQDQASRLRDENRLLGDARSSLRSGDPASALAKLDAASGRFPDGVLAQEREVLAIEALAKSGQGAAASSRASAFLRAYPTSPHAAKVRGFVQ